MRPSDRTIRDELRREAAETPIPDDMWKNISRRLDQDAAQRERRWQWLLRGAQWRPAMVLAVAAGFFWFALIPALPQMDHMPDTKTTQSSDVNTTRINPGSWGQPITRPSEEPEPKPVQTTSTGSSKPYLHYPTVPQ